MALNRSARWSLDIIGILLVICAVTILAGCDSASSTTANPRSSKLPAAHVVQTTPATQPTAYSTTTVSPGAHDYDYDQPLPTGVPAPTTIESCQPVGLTGSACTQLRVAPLSYTVKPVCDPNAKCGPITDMSQSINDCTFALGKPYAHRTIALMFEPCPGLRPYSYEIFPKGTDKGRGDSLYWLVNATITRVTKDSTGCHIRGTLLDSYWVSYYAGGVSDYGVTITSKHDCAQLHVGMTAALPNTWNITIPKMSDWNDPTPNAGWHVTNEE